jgi:hypothetical protein
MERPVSSPAVFEKAGKAVETLADSATRHAAEPLAKVKPGWAAGLDGPDIPPHPQPFFAKPLTKENAAQGLARRAVR